MEALRPNQKRAKLAQLFIYIIIVFHAVSIISGYMQYELLSNAAESGITDQEAELNDLRETVIAVLIVVTYVVSVIVFLNWFRRAYFNLHLLMSERLEFSEGWAVGAWFVPLINLYRPYRIMMELFDETESYLRRKKVKFDAPYQEGLVISWWITWILGGLIGRISWRVYANADTIDEFVEMTIIDMITSGIIMVSGLLVTKLIKDYSQLEQVLAEHNNSENGQNLTDRTTLLD
ncbi:DUF4328 domain-containing protein [Echinicola strongylocentroti]|uniref:DUF4328 domain-containing protein n=1 Tax=Echinicola strongylocentroti TaxID=1795355 RepID=A0A2Z4IJL3_9BACT|nr:DUF4328 domain-containing protein [Echinicola strongylocentroti]AWW30593.1 DUF4328 domain-containing protein [Echinicola strongylocentroti]